jgi:hypothetical protein
MSRSSWASSVLKAETAMKASGNRKNNSSSAPMAYQAATPSQRDRRARRAAAPEWGVGFMRAPP